jgi:diguanylate cyclase (GGDEF)-like protein
LEWLPTVLLLAVVLIGGSRLIYLSVQHHAAAARVTASTVADTYVKKIEPELQKLVNRARGQAGSAAARSLDSIPPVSDTFWMSAEDKVLSARPTESATASGIASEFRAAESARMAPGTSVFGPMRLGSEWLVAARVPVLASGPGSPTQVTGWSVAYANLDELLTPAHLERLIDKGYDFEISQVEPRSVRSRSFLSSSADPLDDAVGVKINLPNGAAAAIPGSYLQVAIRPRAGWYPATELASDIGLLAFLAWLIAFGTQELTHELQASRAVATATQLRLRAVNQQLAAEMQQRANLQETFDHARFHDAFTGLPNRRYFMDQLDRALRDVRTKRHHRIAVIIVDISRFKLVNDMLGHTAGDELMVETARRFGKLISTFDGVLARWSGDQFAVLLLDVASTEAALQVTQLLLQELRAPVELRRHRLVVTATIGLTTVDSGQLRAEDVIREADLALTVAKRKDSAKIVLYAPSMAGQAASLVSLEADLHVAMEKRELQLVFQPIVNLRTYQMVGAEALLRWRHPVESVLAPAKFLRIAEEAGLMVPITRWIVFRVVKLAEEWRRQLPANQHFFISMNVSPTALLDPGLSEHIADLLRETQLPPSVLKFEVTEAALISNAGAARDAMDRLHAMGVQLMLDDFGTGYSSLSYLQLFPFDFVKIDRPFVNRTGADQANSGMMAAMVQMAGSLNLTSIAEIIETEAAAKALQAMGCDYGQGYYFSEPIEADLALLRLRSQDPFRPAQDASSTVMVRPLEEPFEEVDESATGIFRPLQENEEEEEEEEDTSHTVIFSEPIEAELALLRLRSQDPFRPAQDASSTIMVRPLEETFEEVDESATGIFRPLQENEEEEEEEDTSHTVILPASSIKFSPGGLR